ncbi:MAG TPA: ADOP family duplicated permease [Gemmatimonadaceae bacterium]|nr:ADOP family duplicated permease [Gemmatimonadaceae bacterium]
MTHGWRRLLRLRFGRTERDVDDEVRFHIAERVADLEALGETPEAARERALEEFGDVDAVRAELVEIDRGVESMRRRAGWWEGMVQDARHVARGLLRSPGFTATVVVTLALGIGANAVVFSLIDRLFFQPPAGVPHPEMVRRVKFTATSPVTLKTFVRGVYNYPEFRSVAAALPAGVAVAGYVNDKLPLGSGANAPTVRVEYAVGEYFRVLGLEPGGGRFFEGGEQSPAGLTPVAVISHELWLQYFDGRHDVLGDSLRLGAHNYTVIGVAPAGFEGVGLDAAEVWLPFNALSRGPGRKADWYEEPHTFYVHLLARGEWPAELHAAAAAATNALRASEVVHDSAAIASLEPLRGAADAEFHTGEFSISRRLAGVATIIFLIACANVANLLLVRALGRRRETAVRLALGVGRRRLAAQFMGEAVFVAALGGVVAILLTWWTSRALRHVLLPSVQWGSGILTTRVIVFAIVAALAAGIAAGLVPAIQAGDPELVESLRGGAREGRMMRSRTRTTLLIVQTALSVVLLVGAGLFIRSLRQVEGIDIGYDSNRLVFAYAVPTQEDTSAARRVDAMLPMLAERLAHIPDVERVSLAAMAPMYGFSTNDVFIPGVDSLAPIGPFGLPTISVVSPEYFGAVGVSIREGRGFDSGDIAGSEPVVVINRTMARSYWPNGDALGSCIILGKRSAPCRRVVGIASDSRVLNVIEDPAPSYYVPITQAPDGYGAGVMVIRTRSGRVDAAAAAITRELRAALGTQARPRVQSMEETLASDFHTWKLGASLFSAAGLLALLVAGVGIYSTVAYMVGQRTHEIGVRMALGAASSDIARVVIGHGVSIVVAGVATGVLASLAMGSLVASLLYGVTPRDPLVLGAVVAMLLLVAVAACLVPAWRAMRVDPMETLRTE